jgi:hypothetical protein
LLLNRTRAEVDVSDKRGGTPLTVAFTKGDQKSVALLLGAGAAVEYEMLGALGFGGGNVKKKSNDEMFQFVRNVRGDLSNNP